MYAILSVTGRSVRSPLIPKWLTVYVFWTKNPTPLLPYLTAIEEMGYRFYFQFTLTPYDQAIERNVPDKALLIRTFQELAERIGPRRVVWRYDPIILSPELSMEKHVELFAQLAAELKAAVNAV